MGFYQTVECGVACRFSPVGYSGLVEDAAHVVVHRTAADDQLITNLPVRLPSRDETQHLHLALAQAIGVGRSSGWLGCGLLLKSSHRSISGRMPSSWQMDRDSSSRVMALTRSPGPFLLSRVFA